MPRKKFDWTAEHIARLGTMPDEQLGRELGLSSIGVLNARRRYGVAPYQAPPWPPEHVALLGTMSDRALAERLGVRRAVVRDERLRRGIESIQPLHPRARRAAPSKTNPSTASPLPAYIVRDVERAIAAAEKPQGPGVHDGKAVIPASYLRVLLEAAKRGTGAG